MTTTTEFSETIGIVIRNKRISPTTAHLTIEASRLFSFKSGQLCQVTIEYNKELLKRPYSIASAPWEQHLELCIKDEGKTGHAIAEMKPRDTMTITSPIGKFTLPEQLDHQHYLFIGVGTGIAPHRSMIRTIFRNYYTGKGDDTNKHIMLLFGAKTKEEILYQEEFEQLASARENFKYHITLSREDVAGKLRGYVQQHLITVLPEPRTTCAFICGHKDMVIAVKNELIARGVPKENIHQESY